MLKALLPTLADPLSVQVDKIDLQASRDAYSTFVELQARYGENSVYLLESLGGPAEDNQNALVGVQPLLEIEIRDAHLSVQGLESLREKVDDVLSRAPEVSLDADGYLLNRRVHVWDVIRRVQSLFDVSGVDADEFGFGFLTVVSYEAISYIEDFHFPKSSKDDFPDFVLRIFATTLEFDLQNSHVALRASKSECWESTEIGFLRDLLSSPREISAKPPLAPGIDKDPLFNISETEYIERAEKALNHIHQGDIYQVQLGHEVLVDLEGCALDVYARMRHANPSPYMAYIPFGQFTILSGSPELHVRLSQDTLTMRPIAGTVRREHDEQRDLANQAWLQSNDKEVAEHIMLVDLCRNDLGRVATPGSVDVSDLMAIEAYSHVFHLVSTVHAKLSQEHDIYDVVTATFPAGTMTGTPKIRAMEIIQELEQSRRGVYAGIFGVIGFGGYANLALSIRSILKTSSRYSLRASAGVVVDSSLPSEWRETIAKMSAPARAITGQDLK